MKRIAKLLAVMLCITFLFVEPLEMEQAYGATISESWSEWGDTYPTNNFGLEKKMLYRSRTKEQTVSSSNSLAGWRLEGSEKTWSDWGAWSGWSNTNNAPSNTADRQVEVRKQTVNAGSTTQYRYGRYRRTSGSFYTHYCLAEAKSSGGTWKLEYTGWSTKKLPTDPDRPLNENHTKCSLKDCKAPRKVLKPRYYDAKKNEYYYWEETQTVNNTKTQYSYRIKTSKLQYKFYRWTDWTDWSDRVVVPSNTVEVETKEQYRFRPFGSVGAVYRATVTGEGNSVNLSWNATPGAERYYLYEKSESNASWNQIKSCTGNSTTVNVTPGNHSFAVRPVRIYDGNTYIGDFSGIQTVHTFGVICPAPKVCKTDVDTVYVSWNSVGGATGYTIQYRKKGTSDWEEEDSEENNIELYFSDAVGGYEVRVQPYYVDAKGVIEHPKKTATSYIEFLSAPRNLKISRNAGRKSVVAKWSAPSKGDFDGYEVYKSTKSKSGFTKARSVKKGKAVVDKLKKGKRYYFKVRAYERLDNGTKIYGPFSTTKSIIV